MTLTRATCEFELGRPAQCTTCRPAGPPAAGRPSCSAQAVMWVTLGPDPLIIINQCGRLCIGHIIGPPWPYARRDAVRR